MLEVRDVTVALGDFRLRQVQLDVAAGECHAVLGPSGCGKTTLLRAILGVVPIEGGSVVLDREDLNGVPIEHRGLGYLPQTLGLFPHLTARQNIEYSARARKIPPATFAPLVRRLTEVTEIGHILDRMPATLSGGERQRVGLVRALAGQPRVVLFDEPFTALGESLRRELWTLLQDLRREWQLTTLLVTHDLAEAYALAHRVTVLLDGRVVQHGATADVFARPGSPTVARFLGIENVLQVRAIETDGSTAIALVHEVALRVRTNGSRPTRPHVGIRAEDVTLLPTHEPIPNRAAACNLLEARIVSLQPGTALTMVRLDAGFPLQAAVPRPECERQGWRVGQSVRVLIEEMKVHLMGESAGPGSSPPEP